MTERLLQFIWQFQYFSKSDLVTANGELVQIINPGLFNTNQGPDFLNARIVIGAATWAGTVELHLKTSDWNKHGHQEDKNYANVILHVVWENDGDRNPVPVNENSDSVPADKRNRVSLSVPVIELKNRVAKLLLQRYEELMLSTSFIPCEKNIAGIRDITWKSWKERLLAERLLRKSALAETFLRQNNYHWEETFWWLLARNFGMKVNADAFESIARSISLNVLAKYKNQIHRLEALLFGQAGLLEKEFLSTDSSSENDYPILLQKEYRFLQKKYNLRTVPIPLYSLRMRPENFPSVRLAELAMLVHESAHLFSKIKEPASVNEIKKYFEVTANDYWHYHYQFSETSPYKKKKVGVSMVDNIIINTVAPLLFTFGSYHNENGYKDRAIQCLEEIQAEKNPITKGFKELNIEIKNARDSQALIELKNEYCNKKRCLECGIGNAVLRN
ncbi:MAG TPA: DUF2851 family protein [Chitinophagaceae bacterium]|nr:DUF2851 family protein [Chitinophagaceae bacterium]